MGVKRALSYLRATGPTFGPRCEHRKVALLIGILYHNNECHDPLRGTHEDVWLMKTLLINTYHYSAENIMVLMDDGDHKAPTKANIEEAMRSLVAGTREGGQLFFHYSGHGSQTECKFDDPTEDDGFDEAIIPCDATSNPDTWIIDNDMNEILVKRLPVNAQLVAVFDMCHSGTALDLKHYKCYKKDLEGNSRSSTQPGSSIAGATSGPRAAVFSIPQGSIHVCKRTTPREVEKEELRLNDVPARTADKPNNPQKRRLSITSRKNTKYIDCELTPIPESVASSSSAMPPTSVPAAAPTTPYCSKCGGSLSEVANNMGDYEQPGFVPARPRSLSQVLSGAKDEVAFEGRADGRPGRHMSDPLPITHGPSCDATSSCLCPLRFRFAWPPIRFKRSSAASNGGKHDKKPATAPPSRKSTASNASFTPLIAPVARAGVRRSTPTTRLDSVTEEPAPISPTLSVTSVFGLERTASPDAEPTLEMLFRRNSPRDPEPQADPPAQGLSPQAPARPQPKRKKALAHPRKCSCGPSRPGSPRWGQVISIAASKDGQLTFEDVEGRSMTKALVEILEKNPHPTYRTLMASIKFFLLNISDEIREDYYKLLLKSAATGAAKKAAARAPARSKSRSRRQRTGSNVAQDLQEYMTMMSTVVQNARGGPVQEAVLGSEHRFDMDIEIVSL